MIKSLVSIGIALDREIRNNNINIVEFKVVNNIDSIVHKCKLLGINYEKIEKDTERDHYLNSKEALEYGLVDKIL